MDTLSTLFAIDTHIINGFIFRTHFLSAYEFRNVLKRPTTLLKVLRELRIKENLQTLVYQLTRFQCSYAAKTARLFVLITIITKFLRTFMCRIRCYLKITISAYLSALAD
jgi:hypothetical protein